LTSPLGRAIVDLQITVVQKTRQCLPLIQGITHGGGTGRAIGENFWLQFEQVFFQFADIRIDARCRNASLCAAENDGALARFSTAYTRVIRVRRGTHAFRPP
jgi:hypothetical protein